LKVVIDTTFARRGPTGTGVYLERLVPALRALGVEVEEAANERRRPPAGGGVGSLRNAAADRWWTAVELPRRARAAGADVLHHALPAHAAAPGAPPQVVTLHDLAFERVPAAFDPRFRAFARRVHRTAARRADAVIAVSETTARDATALWGVPPERIVVARHGPGHWEAEASEAPDDDPEHFLYVGDAEPRKNLPVLLAGYAAYRAGATDPLPLVLAGTARATAPGVRVEERPTPGRLARLYGAAVALVHPALHEGFGMAPLEAMAAGTPVVAARAPGVTETCGAAARYFDPRDPDDLAAALREIANDAQLRARLSAAGRARAAEFSWERSARAHLRAYTLAAKSR
jgi:glycosyltransferase involved in cell wall biosynthesis